MTTHSAPEVPNRLIHHVLEEASFLILLTVLDAAVAANMLAVAQILALLLGIDRRCSECTFCVFGNSFGSLAALLKEPACHAKALTNLGQPTRPTQALQPIRSCDWGLLYHQHWWT
jgi:hypothetical protein